MKKQAYKKVVAFSAASLLALSIAQAAPVNVNNYSFEAATGGTLSDVTGWGGFGYRTGHPDDIGALVGTANGFTIAPPDGVNELYLNVWNGQGTAGVYQDIGALQADTTYTLTVAIGLRNDSGPWGPGIISLINGTSQTDTVLATDGGLPATKNTWQDYTITYTTGDSVTGDLTIMLSDVYTSGDLIQANFDNVRLDATTAPVPEPTTCALLGGGLLSLMAFRRRKSA